MAWLMDDGHYRLSTLATLLCTYLCDYRTRVVPSNLKRRKFCKKNIFKNDHFSVFNGKAPYMFVLTISLIRSEAVQIYWDFHLWDNMRDSYNKWQEKLRKNICKGADASYEYAVCVRRSLYP